MMAKKCLYDFRICTFVYSLPINEFITNPQNDQLPIDLLAQLIEHCTDIADVMGLNLEQAWNFFRLYYLYCSSSVHNCDDHRYIFIKKVPVEML